jgi:hypothetical protein
MPLSASTSFGGRGRDQARPEARDQGESIVDITTEDQGILRARLSTGLGLNDKQ